MAVVTRHMRKLFDRELESLDVTRSQWTVIAVVARRPGVTQRTIAEALDTSEAATGRLVERLCADGLLERRPHAEDGRAWCVYLTNAARPILDNIVAVATRQEERAFRGIGAEDLAKLASLLDQIYRNVRC